MWDMFGQRQLQQLSSIDHLNSSVDEDDDVRPDISRSFDENKIFLLQGRSRLGMLALSASVENIPVVCFSLCARVRRDERISQPHTWSQTLIIPKFFPN